MNPIKKCFKLSMQEGSLGNLSIRKLWSTTVWKAKPFWGIKVRAVNIRFCRSNALPSSIGRSIIHFIVTERKKFFALLKKKKKEKENGKGDIQKDGDCCQVNIYLPFLSIQINLQEVHNKHKCLPCNKCVLKHLLCTWLPQCGTTLSQE